MITFISILSSDRNSVCALVSSSSLKQEIIYIYIYIYTCESQCVMVLSSLIQFSFVLLFFNLIFFLFAHTNCPTISSCFVFLFFLVSTYVMLMRSSSLETCSFTTVLSFLSTLK